MHKSVLYLICTCEQPSAPGSYRRPGKAGGYPRKKKATCLQSLNAVSQQAPSGMGGGAVDKNGRQEEKGHEQRVYASRPPCLGEGRRGGSVFAGDEGRGCSAGQGVGVSQGAPREHGKPQRGRRAGRSADPAAPRPRDSAARGTAPGCAPAAPWMFLQHLAGSGGPPKKHPDTPRPLGPGRAPLWAPGPPRSPRRPAALGLGLWRRRRRRLLHGG